MERFKQLLPQIVELKELVSKGQVICWEAYDSARTLLGYAWIKEVPDSDANFPGIEDMDKYQIFGILDPRSYRIIKLDIALHPDMSKEPWTEEVMEEKFEKQFVGISASEMALSPDGKIDAISEATLSSTWVTDAIREKIIELTKQIGEK